MVLNELIRLYKYNYKYIMILDKYLLFFSSNTFLYFWDFLIKYRNVGLDIINKWNTIFTFMILNVFLSNCNFFLLT